MKNSVKYYTQNNRIKWLYLIGTVFLFISAVLGIVLGSTPLSFSEIADAFTEGFNESAGTRIFAYSRLPRTLASLVCGAALAVAALGAEGESILEGIHYIERGYVDLDKMLRDVGADIIKL